MVMMGVSLFVLLAFTICTAVNGQGSSCSWTSTMNSNSPGGTGQPSITDLTTCQNQCTSTSCQYGFDWDPTASTKCWFSTSATVNTNGASGVTHYTWSCNTGSCNVWNISQNSNSPGGILNTSLTTIAACENYCFNTVSCYGFDWTTSNQCWLSTTSQINYNNSPGVAHYQWIDCSSGSSNAPPPTTTTTTILPTASPGCNGWTQTNNSNSPGGNAQSSVTSLSQCQSQCMAQANACKYGFDWNGGVVQGQQCWFSTSATISVNGYQGVVHYQPCIPTTNPSTTAGFGNKNSDSRLIASGFITLALMICSSFIH